MTQFMETSHLFTLPIPNHISTAHAHDFAPTTLSPLLTIHTYYFTPLCSHLLKRPIPGTNLVTVFLSPIGPPWFFNGAYGSWWDGFPGSFCLHVILCFLKPCIFLLHVRWVPCHHGMACLQIADGGDTLQFWRVAANILNKQWRTADKGSSSSLGVGRGANNSP
jgi:hypothetical protein